MDEEAERRGMDRLGPPRPLLEREVRWAAEGIKRDRSEVLRQPLDDATAPPVERMLSPVPRLLARGESVPARASGHADEQDRADVRERALPLAVGKMERAACDKAGARDGKEDGFDLYERRRQSGVTAYEDIHGIRSLAGLRSGR